MPLIALLCICASALAYTPIQRKSRYYALLAIQKGVEGKLDESHELYKLAYRLDPSNKEAEYAYGLGMIALAEDSIKANQGLSMMREYVDSYPADFQENTYYAYLCRRVNNNTEAQRVLKRLYGLYPDKNELLLSLAEVALALDEFDSALNYYSDLERVVGESPELTLRKMSIWLYQTDTTSVLREADRLIAKQPASAEYYLLKGNLMSFLQKPDSALYYYKKGEAVEPNSGAAKLALAGFYNEVGDSVAYEKAVYDALLIDDVDIDAKIEMLTEYIVPILTNKKGTEHADYLLNTLLNQYPHEPEIQNFASQYSAEKGDLRSAVDQITIAIDMDPENMEYKARRIRYLIANADYEEAIKAYEQVPKDNEMHPSMLFMAAAAYTGAHRHEEALKEVDGLITTLLPEYTPSDSLKLADLRNLNTLGIDMVGSAFSLRGDILYGMDRSDEAFVAYENAITASPDDSSALNNYAYYLEEKGGDLEKALEMSRRAVTLTPDNSTFLDTYAWILFKLGKNDEALEQMQKAMDTSTEADLSYELYEHYGDILFMNGRPAEAVQAWEKALKLNPTREILRRKVKHKTYFYE